MVGRLLHVANGSRTTRLIDASCLGGRTLSWADSLYDGPVPDVSDATQDRIRALFHAPREETAADYANGFAEWRATIDDTDQYDELVLWLSRRYRCLAPAPPVPVPSPGTYRASDTSVRAP